MKFIEPEKSPISIESIESKKRINDLRKNLVDEVTETFWNGAVLQKEKLKKNILELLPQTDSVMLDVYLDVYIKEMQDHFSKIEIMKDSTKNDSKIKEKFLIDIKNSVDFLLENI